MLESGQTQAEPKIQAGALIADVPAVRKRRSFLDPVTRCGTFCAEADIGCFLPFAFCEAFVPNCLRFRAGKHQLAESLQFFEPAAIKQLILRSEEHTSELQSLMRISYAVFCLKKKK